MSDDNEHSLQPARERLLTTAAELFYQHGTHLGVNKLFERSGVSRVTFYRYFASKERLIEAVLERRAVYWRRWFKETVERHTDSPQGRLLAVFDALEAHFDTPEFRGCTAINFAAEAADPTSKTHALALRHKDLVRGYLEQLARDAGIEDASRLADELSLLLNGATVMAQLSGTSEPARQAKRAAHVLVRQALE